MKRFFIIILSVFLFANAVYADTAETIYARAYAHIYKNNPKAAVGIFEKGISTYPDASFLYAGIGDAYLKIGNYDKAIEMYTIAQTKKYSIDNYKIDFYNANLQKTMKDISSAINTLLELSGKYDNVKIYRNINSLLNEKYDKTSLITEIFLSSDNEALNKANEIKAKGKLENALKEYLKILNTDSTNYLAANNAGVTLLELKDYNLADKYLKQANQNYPDSPVILNNLAVLNLYQKKYNDMNNNFKASLNAKSDYAPAINNFAISKISADMNIFQTQNINAIIDVYKKDNSNLYAIRTLSKIYLVKNEYRNANNLLSSINSTYNYKLYEQKAYAAFMANDLNNASNHINKSISLCPNNSNAYLLKGRIYDALGQYSAAKTAFSQAISLDKNNFSAYYFNARTYYKSGDRSDAVTLMQNYLSMKKANSETSQINILFE